MANLKRVAQVSDWLTYELETELLEPPTLRVKLRPLDAFDSMDASPGEAGVGTFLSENALAAVVEWDLTDDGKPIPVTPENKAGALRPLLGEKVKDRGQLLGLAIYKDSRDRKVFLGN